jgi:hypothetical protein
MISTLKLEDDLRDVQDQLHQFAGMIASFGIRIKQGTFQRMSTRLKRIDAFLIPETVTALEQTANLIRNGIMLDVQSTLQELLEKRSTMISDAILSFEDNHAIMEQPDLPLNIRNARIDPQVAIETFCTLMGRDVPAAAIEEKEDDPLDAFDGPGLFNDYMSSDLPESHQVQIGNAIQGNVALRRHSHDELIAIKTLRDIILKVEHFGYGVALCHRRHFSRARRSFLWAAPRIGHIMVQHPLTWRHHPKINTVLHNIRHYDRHMRDMAKIAADDDWFNANSPIIIALKKDVQKIDTLSEEVVRAVREGPSGHRFSRDFYSVMPTDAMNFAPYYQPDADALINAMRATGIGNKAERDMARSNQRIQDMIGPSENTGHSETGVRAPQEPVSPAAPAAPRVPDEIRAGDHCVNEKSSRSQRRRNILGFK